MSSSSGTLSVEQALSLVKSSKSLRSIIKTDSLVVNGLERNWDRANVELELKGIFKVAEGVKDIKIITNNVTQELLGHAYINYVSQEAAKKALQRHKYTAKIRGKQLKMMFSVRPNDLIHEDEIKMHFSVCVKNLDPAIDLQSLDNKFSKYGDILRSHVDDDTHSRDRFALIQFMDMSSAQEAVRKNQKTKFGNTIITVEPYRPKLLMESTSSDQFDQSHTSMPTSQSSVVHLAPQPAPPPPPPLPEQTETPPQSNDNSSSGGEGWQRVNCMSGEMVTRRTNGRPQQYYSEILVSDRGGGNVNANGNARASLSSPSLLSEQDLNAQDSARSQINQQSTVASLLGSQDGLQLSKNSSSSPTAVSPPPVDQIEFTNTYKLFEGSQIFNSHFLFGNDNRDQIDLIQLLPSSVSSELDEMQLYKCPLSGDIYRDPVMASDGVVYERSALEAWLAKNQYQQKIDPNKLYSVVPLREALAYIKQQRSFITQQQTIIDGLKKRLEQIKNISSGVQF